MKMHVDYTKKIYNQYGMEYLMEDFANLYLYESIDPAIQHLTETANIVYSKFPEGVIINVFQNQDWFHQDSSVQSGQILED